jgi:UDP-N-acetylglucosamine 2-epimerase (non-hydrolysing)
MRKPLVCLVAGARPNFVKVAPLDRAFRRSGLFRVRLVHTGQHYDDAMSGSFFRDLGMSAPDASLNVGSGSHAAQTARVLDAFEQDLLAHEPDLVVVVGDVNSTSACALAAAKMHYPDGRRPRVAHVEAGLRSFDRGMPEEINRIVTDSIADYLFVTEPSGADNLSREGHPLERVFLVGNVMIDTLLSQAARARARGAWRGFGMTHQAYGVVTLHRPSNVDDPCRLLELAAGLESAAASLPLIFPVHPRTRARLDEAGAGGFRRLVMCDPLPYIDCLSLLAGARAVITDSGGIQEETTVLGVPCLTLRDTTERPITITHGTNRLIGSHPAAILRELETVLSSPMPNVAAPPLWDGRAAERIVDILERAFVSNDALVSVAAAAPGVAASLRMGLSGSSAPAPN